MNVTEKPFWQAASPAARLKALEREVRELRQANEMARREAFPFDGVKAEEIGTCFVDDAIADSMENLDGWFDLPASGNLELVSRTSHSFTTHGRTRFITDPTDLAATLKRHGLPEAWATDRDAKAWAPRPDYGPTFEEAAERIRELAGDRRAPEAKQNRRRAGFEL